MPGLILKLRAHEQILVNGVVMQNGDRNARLIIKTPDAKILRLRDAIHPDDVNTPVKRVCYIAQLAVAGEVEAEKAAQDLSRGIAQLADALAGIDGAAALQSAMVEVRRRNFYACLRHLRQLLPLEAALLAASTEPEAITPRGAPQEALEPKAPERALTVGKSCVDAATPPGTSALPQARSVP
ncbi:MAG: flagellar biosynthesis repressor FlbT [Pseudomonadota bacterium]